MGKVYAVRCSRYETARGHVLITRRWPQRLGDMTDEEIGKEGFESRGEFESYWALTYGWWDSRALVTAYEFHLV